jgi:hypothetical protein
MKLKALYAVVNLAFFVALAVSLERQAHAYTDPGTALLVFQSASAAVTAGLFYFRRKIKSLFTKPEPTPPVVKLERTNF